MSTAQRRFIWVLGLLTAVTLCFAAWAFDNTTLHYSLLSGGSKPDEVQDAGSRARGLGPDFNAQDAHRVGAVDRDHYFLAPTKSGEGVCLVFESDEYSSSSCLTKQQLKNGLWVRYQVGGAGSSTRLVVAMPDGAYAVRAEGGTKVFEADHVVVYEAQSSALITVSFRTGLRDVRVESSPSHF